MPYQVGVFWVPVLVGPEKFRIWNLLGELEGYGVEREKSLPMKSSALRPQT